MDEQLVFKLVPIFSVFRIWVFNPVIYTNLESEATLVTEIKFNAKWTVKMKFTIKRSISVNFIKIF